ncbi:MAG: glycoside hydrolase family 92 protein [Sphingobacteriaceae bacterium]|nr:MAG: glycoside hydrolase family 92 protein [Sphingobacteriaceae bacterium]
MKKPIIAALSMLCILLATNIGKSQNRYVKYVNTFIGTTPMTDPKILGYTLPNDWRSWAGLTFPGSSLPNAMVQLSPVTEYGSGSGYQHEDAFIYGFTHTNKGHWNLCNIPVLPVSTIGDKFRSRFSHKQESAEPGYYQVFLDDYDVDVRLTSTLRCGYHQYKFKDGSKKYVLFDLGKANNRVRDWKFESVDSVTIQGYQDVGEKIYFYAKLNTPIKDVQQKNQGKRFGNALLRLADGGNKTVEIKIGISFVSTANAKQNLEQEIGSQSFDQIRAKASDTWEKLLSAIEVKGGTPKQTQMFYSSLYRSLLWPALRSDVNGEFTDAKKNVVKADFRYYTEPSLWDTYRNKDVLLGLISPDVTLDVIKSMKDVGEKTGFIPTFFHGDHGASSIAGAYLRGIDDFDIKATYQILLRSANVPGARPYIEEYIKKGYISDPDIAKPEVETKAKAGVSKTLEYSYDDYSLAQIAKKLGDTENYNKLMARSKNYKNMFDPSTRFMRGRRENGEWIQNFDPQQPYYEYMYREANAWQVSFFAPHDMPGLIKLYGGPKKFEQKLDSLFTVPWNPNHIARNVETFIGQYCHGNQPDHEAPFSYIFINKPEKSQKILDRIMNDLYGIGDDGLALSGMDDAGEMSAWYVFSSLGLYTFSATDPEYIVTVPLFENIKWHTSTGKVLDITHSGKGRKLTAIKVNGKTIKGYFVPHNLFNTGGKIEMITSE